MLQLFRSSVSALALIASLGGSLLMGAVQPAAAGVIEDFEGGPSDLANYTNTGVTANINAVAAHDGNFGLQVSDAGGWIYRNDAQVHVSQGHTLSAWLNLGDLTGRAYFGFGASASGALSAVLGPNTSALIIQNNANFSNFPLASTPQTFLANHWYLVDVVWGVGGNITVNLFDSDGTTLLNTVSATDNSITSGGIAFRGFFGTQSFDTVCVDGCTQVPEPATLTLFSAGLLGLAAARRRKAA